MDDYNDILHFLTQFSNAESISVKIAMIFEQYVNHRVATSRILNILVLHFFDQINFTALIALGSIALLGVSYLFCLQFKNHVNRWYIWIFIAFFTINITAWDSIVWATAATSNFFVAIFVFLSISFLHQVTTKRLILAIIFGLLASSTFASGLFVWVSGAAMLLIQQADFSIKKPKRALTYWIIVSSVCISLYFYNYKVPVGSTSVFEHLIATPLEPIKWFLAFLGSFIVFDTKNIYLAMTVGTVNLVSITILATLGYWRRYPILFSFSLFIFLSAALTSLGRFYFLPVEYSLTSRYKIYSVWLACMSLTLWYDYISNKAPNWVKVTNTVFIIISLVFWSATYSKNLPKMKAQKYNYTKTFNRWLVQGFLRFRLLPDAGEKLKNSIQFGIYNPEAGLYEHRKIGPFSTNKPCIEPIKNRKTASKNITIINKQNVVMLNIKGMLENKVNSQHFTLKFCSPDQSFSAPIQATNLMSTKNPNWDMIDLAIHKKLLADTIFEVRIESISEQQEPTLIYRNNLAL